MDRSAHPRQSPDRHREPPNTPVRIRVLALTAAVLVVALAALLTVEVVREHSGLEVIGEETAPVVMASSAALLVALLMLQVAVTARLARSG